MFCALEGETGSEGLMIECVQSCKCSLRQRTQGPLMCLQLIVIQVQDLQAEFAK